MVVVPEAAVFTTRDHEEVAHQLPAKVLPRERIFIELMTSDRKLKASREGSK